MNIVTSIRAKGSRQYRTQISFMQEQNQFKEACFDVASYAQDRSVNGREFS